MELPIVWIDASNDVLLGSRLLPRSQSVEAKGGNTRTRAIPSPVQSLRALPVEAVADLRQGHRHVSLLEDQGASPRWLQGHHAWCIPGGEEGNETVSRHEVPARDLLRLETKDQLASAPEATSGEDPVPS